MNGLKVWTIEEGAWLVRGTQDVHTARRAVVRFELEHPTSYGYGTAREVFEALNGRTAEVGLYRTNPCVCGMEHLFDMARAERPGRGVFNGVLFWPS